MWRAVDSISGSETHPAHAARKCDLRKTVEPDTYGGGCRLKPAQAQAVALIMTSQRVEAIGLKPRTAPWGAVRVLLCQSTGYDSAAVRVEPAHGVTPAEYVLAAQVTSSRTWRVRG
jgi:hypothetical protein